MRYAYTIGQRVLLCNVLRFLLLTSIPEIPQAAKSAARVLTDLSVLDAVELLCTKNVTASEYAHAALARAQELRCLNVYAAINASKLLQAAKAVDAKAAAGEDVRPLCGLALAVKDNIDVAGYATAAGTRALQDVVVEANSPLIDRLEKANGVVLGKTRMHELAEGVTSISPHYGAVLNPYKPDVHVGGSSGGTAALVAASGAAVGFCTDTGGSCRIPASLTGVVGYRPSIHGEVWQQCYNAGSGLVPLTTTRDTVGLIARAVADIKFLDTIFNDCPRQDVALSLRGMRVGIPTDWWTDIGKEAEQTFTAALDAMSAAGMALVEFNVTAMLKEQEENANDEFAYIYEWPRELSRYLFQHRYTLSLPEVISKVASPLVKQSLEQRSYRDLGSWPTPKEYAHILGTVLPNITRMWVKYFDDNGFDVIVVPTTPITARHIAAAEPYSEINGRLEETLRVYARTAEVDCPSSVPGLSIPIGLASDGLPIGLQLHSRPGDDGLMLAVGEALESILPKTPSPPKIPACYGCTAKVTVRKPLEEIPEPKSRADAHFAAQKLSIYDFEMHGSCEYNQKSLERDEL